MTNNFWQNITSPNFSLAPMEDVTDTVFREIVLQSAEQDKLHLLFSEFTSVEGMCHPIGHDKVIHRLQVNQSELQLLKEKNVKLQQVDNNSDSFNNLYTNEDIEPLAQ